MKRWRRVNGGLPDPDLPPTHPTPQAAHHASTRNASIVGVYAANERLADDALPPCARAAGDAAARVSGSARGLALLLDGSTLADFSARGGSGTPPFTAWTHDLGGSGGWKPAPAGGVASSTGAAALFAAAVAGGKLETVADFDDHLIDLGKDWLNVGLVA